VEVTTIISQAILYTEAFVTGPGDMAAYQELLSNRLASWNAQTPVNARVTFKLPLPLDEVEDILSSADISSLRFASSPEGGGGVGYPLDDKDWALLALMEIQLKKDMGDSFKLIEGFVAAEINAQPTTLRAIAEHPEVFVVDMGAVDLLEQYPDAIVIVGNDVAYKYETYVGSQCVVDSLLYFLDDFYAQRLIDDQAVYESLREKLVAAQQKLAQGDYEGAIADLQAFMDEVEAQSGVHIDPEAAEQLLIIADCIEVRTSRFVPEPTPTPTAVPDDVPNSMAEIAETSPNGARIERYINPSGDEDWFRFELAEVSNINVQVTSLPADYDLYLYDADGVLLEASERRGVREERIIRKDQPAGYYYVQVVGYDGAWDADNSYLLRFKVN